MEDASHPISSKCITLDQRLIHSTIYMHGWVKYSILLYGGGKGMSKWLNFKLFCPPCSMLMWFWFIWIHSRDWRVRYVSCYDMSLASITQFGSVNYMFGTWHSDAPRCCTLHLIMNSPHYCPTLVLGCPSKNASHPCVTPAIRTQIKNLEIFDHPMPSYCWNLMMKVATMFQYIWAYVHQQGQPQMGL